MFPNPQSNREARITKQISWPTIASKFKERVLLQPKLGPAIKPHIVSVNHMRENGGKTKAFLMSERTKNKLLIDIFSPKWDISTSVKSSVSQFINSRHMWGVPSKAIIHQWVQGTTE